MSSFLQEELGVAMSGVKWDVAGYKLWQSTRPDVILFTPKQPVLAKAANGRYQVGISQFRQQVEGTYKVTGGSAIFTITSAIQHDPRAFDELRRQWVTEMSGVGPRPPANPRFIPLNVQKGRAEVLINPISGMPNEAHNNKDVGTPGGTNSFLVELSELGAQEWVQGIKERKAIPGGVKMMYEYLRMMPDVGAEVKVHGTRTFTHLSTELKASVGGFWYGGSANIEAAWENLVRNGAVEITFIGTLPPELESIRQELVTTFSNQAREQLFSSLFQPKPDIEPAQAGNTSGFYGGANFALKWKSERESTDLRLTLRFKGWTWLQASMDADVTALLHECDESYINEVNTQMSFPAAVVVDSDPMLENVAVSWSASEGKSPEAPVYGPEGGNNIYTVTSQRPQNVEVSYTAKVNFAPPSWPVITTTGKQKISEGGNQVVVKPSSWIGRHMIYMFVREGDQIKLFGVEDDYLIVNVSYTGPHLSRPIRASSRITPLEPIEFSYPLSPEGAIGEAKFSAFGVVGGKLLRSAEQKINFDEEAVFILASANDIKLVSQAGAIPESDKLAHDLLAAQAHPIVEGVPSANGAAVETTRPSYGGTANGHLDGTVVGVEHCRDGSVVLIDTGREFRRLLVRVEELADRSKTTASESAPRLTSNATHCS